MVAVSCTISTSSDAPPEFDPYCEWLGLPPGERPYDYYTLLGLRPFEKDRQTISNAAQRNMAQLRKRRQGKTGSAAQVLIAELSKATTCLLNSNRKRLYDQHLRRSEDRSDAAEKPQSRPALPPQVPPPAIDTAKSKKKQPARPTIVASAEKCVRPKPIPRLLVAVIGTAALVVIAAGIFLAMRIGTGDTIDDEFPSVAAAVPGAPFAAAPSVSHPQADPLSSDHSDTTSQSTEDPAATTTPNLPSSEFELPTDSTIAPSSPVIPAEDPLPPEVPLPFAASDDDPKSIRFTGTDRISLSEPLTSLNFAKPFTLEMWVRFEKGTDAHWLMGDLVLGNVHPGVPRGVTSGWQAWIMRTDGGKQRFAIATGRGFWAEYPASDETWRHLAVSGDGATVSIFVDGRRAASQTAATLAEHHVASPLPLHFGSHNYMRPTQPSGLQGQMCAARISTSCRYRVNFTPPVAFDHDDATELVFDFQHAESSRRINDLSSHARHGTLRGAQWIAMADADLVPAAATVATSPPAATPDPPVAIPMTPSSGAGGSPPATKPVPSETELQVARQQIETLFETEIAAARRRAEQLALAAKLVSLAGQSTDDVATQFALFEMAVDRLAQGSDLSKSLKVIDDFASQFTIDRLARQAAVIRTAGSGPRTLAQRQELAETALRVGEEMKRAGRFELAVDVSQAAVTAATRARSPELGKRARQLRDEAKRSSRLAAEAELARQKLVTAPKDPSANLIYGKFLCLQMNQWDLGAALLAKSDDEAIRLAAAAESKADAGAETQAAAAELWYEARTAIDKQDLPLLLEHVLELSRTAAPGLKGIAKLSIEKRMQQIAAELPAKPSHATSTRPALPRFEPPAEFQSLVGRLRVDGRDASILWKYRSGLRLANSNVKDILLQAGIAGGHIQIDFVGKLNLPETTTVNVMHQGGAPLDATATLYVDGKLIGILGGENASSDIYKLDLAKGEHTVAWHLAGRDLATNSLRFIDAAEAAPLVIYHDVVLLNAVRDTPSRARLTVNLMGGPGIR